MAKKTVFKYGSDENGAGRTFWDLSWRDFISRTASFSNSPMTNFSGKRMHTNVRLSMAPLSSDGTNIQVYYQNVTKYQYDGDNTVNGKMISSYSYGPQNRQVIYFTGTANSLFPAIREYPPYKFVRYGNTSTVIYKPAIKTELLSREYWKGTGSDAKLIRKEEYSYVTSSGGSEYQGLKIWYMMQWDRLSEVAPHYYLNFITTPFDYYYYWIISGRELLASKTVTDYDNGIAATSVSESYEYDTSNRLLTTSITNSDGYVAKETYTYPTLATHFALMNKNMVSTVVTSVKTNNNIETERIHQIFSTSAFGGLKPNIIQTSHGGGALKTEVTISRYDSYGNPVSVTGKDGTEIQYIWSYKGRYPIAEVKNASYTDVYNKLNRNLETFSADTSPAYYLNAINNLRTGLPDAQVSTFEYTPLIGTTKITDPSGIVTYYEYDSYGRLKRIKDHNSKVVEEYYYNYANQ